MPHVLIREQHVFVSLLSWYINVTHAAKMYQAFFHHCPTDQELHLGEALDGVISGFVSVVWVQGSLMARKSGAGCHLVFRMTCVVGYLWCVVVVCGQLYLLTSHFRNSLSHRIVYSTICQTWTDSLLACSHPLCRMPFFFFFQRQTSSATLGDWSCRETFVWSYL